MKHVRNLDPNTREFIMVALYSVGVIAMSVIIIRKNNQKIDEWAEEDPEYWNN